MFRAHVGHDNTAAYTPLLGAVAAVSSLLFVLALLRACAHGFDFTDESFYLIWIAHPFEYALSVTQFGFVYHPVYQWLDGDIIALRRANVLFTFTLATLMNALFLARHLPRAALGAGSRFAVAALLASAACSSLAFTGLWLATPGYNSLCLQAMMLATIGLLLGNENFTVASVSGWIMLGVGGALCFLAKPSSAAALALCSLTYLLATGRWRVSLVLLAVVSALAALVVCAIAIDGSLSAFYGRLHGGIELARALDNRYSATNLLKLGRLRAGQREFTALLAITAITLSLSLLLAAKHRALTWLGVAQTILLATIGGVVILEYLPTVPAPGRFGGLLLFALPLAALVLSVFSGRLTGLARVPLGGFFVALDFVLLSYAYAFGTANDYWTHIAQAVLFAMLGGLVLLTALPRPRLIMAALWSMAFVAQALSALHLYSGMRTPYRQAAPLAAQSVPVTVGTRGSPVQMSAPYAAYIGQARQVLDAAQFRAATPMLDLSGQSPGLLFALGALNVAQAWTIGGYPGSAQLAQAMFRRTSCHALAQAWLLVEPHGKRALPDSVLTSFGADLARDYTSVGAFETAPGASGRRDIKQQHILKPLRSEQVAQAACLASRAESP